MVNGFILALQPASVIDTMPWSLVQIKEVFAVAGGPEGLIHLLGSSSNMDLLVETAWVICHATHSQADANRLVHLGLLQPAVQQIRACMLQVRRWKSHACSVAQIVDSGIHNHGQLQTFSATHDSQAHTEGTSSTCSVDSDGNNNNSITNGTNNHSG